MTQFTSSMLQQLLLFTVLKLAFMAKDIVICSQSVATAPTVYGIETLFFANKF